jgi:hypothetical protein
MAKPTYISGSNRSEETEKTIRTELRADGTMELRIKLPRSYPEFKRHLLQETIAAYGETVAKRIETLPALDEDTIDAVSAASSGAAIAVLAASERHQPLLLQLSKTRRAPVERAAERLVELLTESAHLRTFTSNELEERAQAAIDAFTVLVRGDAPRLRAVIDALDPVPAEAPAEVDLGEAEARGRLRLQALYQKIIKESESVAELAEWGLSRQRLKQLRDAERLFAIDVPFHKGLLYPSWQFDPADHRPRAIMPTLIRAAKEADLDAISFHQIMTNPRAGGGTAPCDLLDVGREDLVLGILAAAQS